MATSLKTFVWLGVAASAIVRTARAAVTVNSTILILARNSTAAQSGVDVLQGYGIPYQVVDLSAANSGLPKLNTTPDAGSFGGIVTVSAQGYTNGDDWNTVISSQQWQDLYRYQEAFGVRLVRLNAWPSEKDFGVQSVGGAVTADQPIAITNSKDFAGANLVDKAQMSTPNLSKYPAKITNASFATEIAQFGSGTSTSTAAIINKFPSGREQQVWFTTFDLSQTSSTLLSHAWINWLTRGLYLGFRRVYLSTQVDDVFVMTELYQTGKSYRFGVNDLKEHVTWMAEVNSKLPAGSSYMIELGHNGNGNIEEAVEHDYDNDPALCDPQEGVEYPDQTDGPPEYMKPIGTGKDLWDKKFKSFSWSLKCSQLDPLFVYLYDKTNAKKYFHVSHTFTHEDETNATYADVVKEISWNQEWFKRIGFSDSSFSDHFSPNGLIPPGITGLHNGDAIRAWLEKNITYTVGDNSRPVLMDVSSRKSPFHPIITNVKENGYAGAYIIGRYGSSIYYNCDLPNCTNTEWKAIAGGSGDFNAQLEYERNTNVKYLLGLRWDPYMFHQANMRVSDTNAVTLLGKNKKWSLLMAWTEAVAYEVTRLTQWPIITLKHDAIATAIISRKIRDECNPTLSYTLSSDRTSITGITVSAADKNCKVEIPVTLPGDVADSTSGVKVRKEQVGKDPVTVWVGLQGKEGVFSLGSAVKVK